MARGREQVAAMLEAEWEIASHGLKWIDYKDVPIEVERDHLRQAVALHAEITGRAPDGFYLGRCSMNTLDLVMEHGGFAYSSDSLADDLPYWVAGPAGPHLIIPYALDTNDMRFATVQGFNSGDQFFAYLKDSFDVLYAEGARGAARMLNVGLHCRLAGRPGRLAALERFVGYVLGHDKVWVPRRIEIARHWRDTNPPSPVR
jgi:peptidoglycan/xylan/chitin deacetylase (PgdA/CDA1 family)